VCVCVCVCVCVFVTCFNRFEGVGEEMTRGCVLTTFLYDGRLHRERRKTEREREKFLYVLHHLRPYNTERRSIV